MMIVLSANIWEATTIDTPAIQKVRLSDLIVKHFQSLLKTGQLRPGDKLPSERDLAKELKVSRTALREALKYLNTIGLVDIRHGGGTFIAEQGSTSYAKHIGQVLLLGKIDIFDLLEARKVIETKTAGFCALRAQAEDIDRIETIVNLMEENLDEINTFNHHDRDFHLAIAKSSRNSALISIFSTISDLLFDQINQVHAIPGVIQEALIYHKKILTAIQERDSINAEKMMFEHLNIAERALRASYSDDNT